MTRRGRASTNPDDASNVGSLVMDPTNSNVVYVGGAFQRMSWQTRPYLAALDARSGRVLDWNPEVHHNAVTATGVTNNMSGASLFFRVQSLTN